MLSPQTSASSTASTPSAAAGLTSHTPSSASSGASVSASPLDAEMRAATAQRLSLRKRKQPPPDAWSASASSAQTLEFQEALQNQAIAEEEAQTPLPTVADHRRCFGSMRKAHKWLQRIVVSCRRACENDLNTYDFGAFFQIGDMMMKYS